MSEIREVDNSGAVIKLSEPQPIMSPSIVVGEPGQIEEMAVAQALGIEGDVSKYSDEIQSIIAWAKREGFQNPAELKWMIHSLQNRLGTPPLSEKWINSVARFAYIQNETHKLQEEERALML